MPGVVKIRNNAGGVYESYVKWLPDEVLHMDYNSLMGMLLEMREFAHFCTDNYQAISSCYDQCAKLQEKRDKTKSTFTKLEIPVIVFGVISALFLFLAGAVDKGFRVFFAFTFMLFIVLLPIMIVFAVDYSRANSSYKRDYQRLLEQGRKTEETFRNTIRNAAFVDYNSGLMVLPAYFTNAMALDFMCDAVRNQRALTLGQAVNLFERYLEEQRRIGLMKAQLAAQQKAASYAQSAAISSAFTATNTFFRW